jgi:hypothetical protein
MVGMACIGLLLAAGFASGQEVERKMRIFDIEFLTASRDDFPGPDLAQFDVGAESIAPPMMDEDCDEGMSDEMLINMIQYNIHPDSWKNSLNSIDPRDGKLVVVQTPEVLAEVERLLKVLRESHVRLVNVRAWAFEMENSYLQAFMARSLARPSGSLLSQEDVNYLMGKADPGAATLIGAVSVTCFSGQRVHAGPLNKQVYVRDLDVEVAQKITIVDPVMGTLLTGFLVDVRPSIVGRHASVLMEMRIGWAACTDAAASVESGVGRIDTPRRALVTGSTTVLVPRGKAFFLSASHPDKPGYSVVFMVKPTALGFTQGKKKEEKKKTGPRRVLRMYDVRLLTSELKDFPGPDLDIRLEADGAGGPAFDEADEGVGFSAEELVELLKSSIEEDSWSNVRNAITPVGSSLVVVQKPQVHEKITAFLEALWARRAVLVFAHLRYIDADRATLLRIAPLGASTLALEAGAMAALEKELRKGKALTLLRSAAITCFNRQRVHIQTVSQQAVIGDVDVEVAESAGIGDPIMKAACGGLVFDFTPILSGDGRHVAVDLRPQIASVSMPVIAKIGGKFPNVVQKFTLRLDKLLTSVTVPDGGTVLFVTGVSPGNPSRLRVVTLTLRMMRVK